MLQLLRSLRLCANIVLKRSSLGSLAIDSRGGGHVEALLGLNEIAIVNFDEVAFIIAFKGRASGVVRLFISKRRN